MGATAGIASAASSLAQGSAAARAAESQGDFSRRQADENARLQELQADEIEKQGQQEASLFRRKARGLIGKQRAALAAQGIDVGTGTAADIQAETAEIAEQDASQIRINAIRQAFGVRTAAINTRSQGEFDQIAGRAAARNALITGGLGAVTSATSAFNFDAKPTSNKSSGKVKSAQGGPAVKDFSNLA